MSQTYYLFGKSGRIGQVTSTYLNDLGCLASPSPANADVWILAIPQSAVPGILESKGARVVIDMSGYCKREKIGVYGNHTLHKPNHQIIQNVGCFASSVIETFRQSQFPVHHIVGGVHIVSVGGQSVTHRSETQSVRVAKRTWDHPHVDEICTQILGLSIDSFVPIINCHQPHGITTIITGHLSQNPDLSFPPPFDANEVFETPHFKWSGKWNPDTMAFQLSSCLDNLHFPAYNAAKIARALLNLKSSTRQS